MEDPLALLLPQMCIRDSINYIGPVIGSHTGPNTMGLFFVGTKR